MGWITRRNCKVYRLKKVCGHRKNQAGNIVPVIKSFEAPTKKEAEAKYRAYLDKEASGIDSKNQDFGIVCDAWIEEFFILDDKLKDATKVLYLTAWNKYIKHHAIYHTPLDQLSARKLQGVYNDLVKNGIPKGSLRNLDKLMKRFYKYLEYEGYSKDYARSLSIPSYETEVEEANIVVWDDEEIETIFSSFDKADYRFRLRFLIVLAYFTGCRISELLALTYDDITEEGLKVTKQLSNVAIDKKNIHAGIKTSFAIIPPKSKKSVRTIPLNPIVLEELKLHKEWHKQEQMKNKYRTDYLFTSDTGEFLDRRNVSRALDRYYKQIGIEPKGVHTYRHTFGTNLCKKGIAIQTASALLGHDNITTTARYYVNVGNDEMQEAVNRLTISAV